MTGAQRLVLALAALSSCADPAAPARPPGTRGLFVVGGTPDAAHDAVVSIVTTADAASPELCSGVVIAPRVIVTAAHCTAGQQPADLVVGVGASAAAPERTLAIASVHTYPGYHADPPDLRGGRDIGVILLADDAGVAPIAIGDASSIVGSEVAVVGFGATDASNLDTRGKRNSATTTVDDACPTLLAIGDAAHAGCHGDSGGPLLATGDGVERVVAIVSYGKDDACDPPTWAVRLDAYAAWLQSFVDGAPDDACTTCPAPLDACFPPDGGTSNASDASDDVTPEPLPPASVTHPQNEDGGCAVARPSNDDGPLAMLLVSLALVARRLRRAIRRPFRV